MYTAKEYQQILISVLNMKIKDLDKKIQEAENDMQEETLSQYKMGLYEAIHTINKSSFLIEEE